MFTGGKISIIKAPVGYPITHQSKSYKILETDRLILKYICKCRSPKTAKIIMKNKTLRFSIKFLYVAYQYINIDNISFDNV